MISKNTAGKIEVDGRGEPQNKPTKCARVDSKISNLLFVITLIHEREG